MKIDPEQLEGWRFVVRVFTSIYVEYFEELEKEISSMKQDEVLNLCRGYLSHALTKDKELSLTPDQETWSGLYYVLAQQLQSKALHPDNNMLLYVLGNKDNN